MEWWLLLLLFFSVLIILMLLGVPIAYSLGFTSLLLGYFFIGPKILYIFGTVAYGQMNVAALATVPLFVLMAEFIIRSGAARDGFDMLAKWMGSLPGGLALASQMICTIFAAVCGASTAATAVIGGMCVPELLNRNYDKRMAVGSIAAGGALAVLIPPSVILIIYGILSETSIGQLFIGGIIPGLILFALRFFYIIILCSKYPSLGPPVHATWQERISSSYKIMPLIFLIFFIFGALYSGIATATEVAGIGAFFSMLIAFWYKSLNKKNISQILLGTVRTTTFIMWILVAASAFGYVIGYLQLPQQLANWVASMGLSKLAVILFINLLLIILGCVMDPGAIVMIIVPLLIPLLETVEIDLIWFGVMFVVNMEIAEITPPLGLNLFIMKGVSPPSVSMDDIMIGSIPFVILDFICLGLVIIFPQLILWLPSKMI